MSDQKTLAYMNAWPKKSLETLTQEYDIDGIIVSGNVKLKAQQVSDLVQYLTEATPDSYDNVQLDFALFYQEDGNKPPISGKLTTPYVKGSSDTSSTKSTKTGTGKKKL